MVVANLLKHKIRFSLIDQTSNPIDNGFHYKGYHYRSGVIDHGKNIGVNHTNEVYKKTKPLLYYMLSTMRRDTEELRALYRVNHWNAIIKIHLIREEDRADYIINSIKYEDCEGGFSLLEGVNMWHSNHLRNLINDKFSIDVEAYVYYHIFIPLKRSTIPIAPKVEAFKEDCCVICVEAKPNILYLDCLHIAVCDFCDNLKIDPSLKTNCEVCRARISKRIKI